MLLDLIRESGVRTVSFVGMAKNVGKTVAYNHLVSEAAAAGVRLGLTSFGRDGEKNDAVFSVPKPRIQAPAGAVIATARGSLPNGEAEVEALRNTGFRTALGEVIVGRVRRAGSLELAGPTMIGQHREIAAALFELGAELVLVDGALDRASSAVPSLTDAAILSTGAALGSGMRVVLERTRDRIERFSLPQVADPLQLKLCRGLAVRAKAALIDRDRGVRILQTESSLTAGPQLAAALTPETRLVFLAGAVGDDVLQNLTGSLHTARELALVINNGTCLFCGRPVWREFMARGGRIAVVDPIRLLAVTLNPTTVTGAGFDPRAFLELAREALAPYPVVDVVLGRGYLTGEI